MKSRKNLIMVALVVLISIVGLTYAFFNYHKLSERNLQLIAGEIYLRLDDGTEQVLLTNAFPETVEEARSRDDNFVTFSIVGKNTTINKDVWYEIMLNEDDPIEGRNKLKLEDLRIDLSEVYEDKTEKLLIDAMSFEDLNARRIWVDTVLRNTTEEQEKTYKLRVWIREDILISDTDPNATYTTGEYANNYMSVKVSVFGDLTEKNNPYQKHYLGRLGQSTNFWPYKIQNKKANVTEVLFVPMTESRIDEAYNAATIKADLKATDESIVKAWLEIDSNDETKYIMKVASPGITVFPIDCNQMFNGWTNLKSITFENIDTSQVTDMNSMFHQCRSLTSLDLSSFDTSKVTNMMHMFYNCGGLTSLNLSSFDTSKVTVLTGMFASCNALKEVDLRSFDTSQVTDMTSMFYECRALTDLDLSGFDTSKVTSMANMFEDCVSLIILDLNNFNTGLVTSMNGMFRDCSELVSLDIGSFDTSQVTTMREMFADCRKLESLDLSNFDTNQVVNMYSMFYRCRVLKSLNISSFDTSQVTSMANMFYECSALTSLNLSSFDTGSVTSMSSMFKGCYNLLSLDLSNFDTSQVTNMASMFYNCNALASLNIGSFIFNDTLKGTANNYSSIFMNVGSNNNTSAIVTVNSTTEQSWILGLTAGTDIPNTWTTDNVVIKNA